MTRQEQASGEGSTNYQAGRDIVTGASVSEVREIALDVFKSNALELRGIAEDTATARAEKVTNEFLVKMFDESPESAKNLNDPDVQHSLFTMQAEYAKSGDEDLGKLLVDLLSARVREDDRNLRTLVLNEALKVAPKLTEGQRRAIALCFIIRHTRFPVILRGAGTVAEMLFRGNLLKLPTDLEPMRDVDFQHIAYAGAGAISLMEAYLGDLVAASQESAFTYGFPATMIRDEVMDSPLRDLLLMPCFRDDSNWQFRVAANQDVDDLIATVGADHLREALAPLRNVGRMQGPAVKAEIVDALPAASAIFDEWDSTALKFLTLTSVGIAIGHAYWQRFGGQTPLQVWL